MLRRHGQVLLHKADVQRWRTPERVAPLPASNRVILLSAGRQIRGLGAEIDGREGEIARGVADAPAVQVLLTITGMGLIGAAATWAILGDPIASPGPNRCSGMPVSIRRSCIPASSTASDT